MLDLKMVEVEERPYLYTERTCSMDPNYISRSMGLAFQSVGELVGKKGIESVIHALSVYCTHDQRKMTFRAGFLVSAEDAAKAEGDVKSDVLPAGRVLNFVHHGPYAQLRDSYDEMMAYLEENGIPVGAPTWEIYVKDLDAVASEDELETDVYVTVEAS